MSNIQSVRADVKAWLSSLVRIDNWDLDSPPELYSLSSAEGQLKAANTATEYPVESLSYEKSSFNSLTGVGKFIYQITFRYPGELTLHQLPIQKLEGLVQYIAGNAVLVNPSPSILSTEVDPLEYPVNPQRDGTDQDDWLVYCNLSFIFHFKVTDFGIDSEYAPVPNQPADINNLTAKIYREKVGGDFSNPADSVLDSEIKLI